MYFVELLINIDHIHKKKNNYCTVLCHSVKKQNKKTITKQNEGYGLFVWILFGRDPDQQHYETGIKSVNRRA